MLEPDFKAYWVEALRSGEYKQGKYLLKKGDKFCCLGVACDLLAPDAWVLSPLSTHSYSFDGSNAAMPLDVCIKIGLSERSACALATANDTGEWKFERIADYIEANL